MKSWTIAKQIYASMGGLIFAIAVVSAVAIFSTLKLSQTFDRYDRMASVVKVGSAIEEDLFEARIAAIKFRDSGSEAEIAEFDDNLSDITQDRVTLLELVSDDAELKSTIDEMYVWVTEYRDAFRASVLRQRDREAVMAGYDSALEATLKALNNAAVTGRAIGNLQAQSEATEARQVFFEGLVVFQNYLFTNTASDLEMALERFAAAKAVLARQGDAVGKLFEASNAAIDAFALLATDTSQAINARNAQFGLMDDIGPKMIHTIEAVRARVIEKQEAFSVSAQGLASIMQTAMAASALICIIAGGFAAFWIARMVSRQLSDTVRRINALADGDLEVDLPDDGNDTEVAQINTAMVAFRENLIESRRLEAEAKEKEERDRLEAEARGKREAEERERVARENMEREEAERAAAAEREAREAEAKRERDEAARIEQEAARRKVIDHLQASVGEVVERASNGDFSGRIDATFEDETLNGLADRINTLLGVVEGGVSAARDAISGLAQGDLDARMLGEFAGDFKDLQVNIGHAMGSLSQLVKDIAVSGDSVHEGSSEISASSDELARRTESAAASIQETTAAVQEINGSLQAVSKNVSEATAVARQARSEAESSGEIVKTAVSVMSEIASSSTRISSIIDVIEDISFQINLLALNAGVEAARAGEAGRGFSVVAAEVRALAQRTSDAVGDITSLISESSENVERGATSVEKASKALENIASGVIDISDRMGSIASAIEEQANGVDGISHAVSDLDTATQHNAAMCEEVTAACASLTEESQTLKSSIGRFQVAKTKHEREGGQEEADARDAA